FTIVQIGRITKIKNPDMLVETAKILESQIPEMRIKLVGDSVTVKDKLYKQDLEKKIEEYGLSKIISFVGSVPNTEIRALYCQADITVNLTPTGGMDKVVLESAASGVPVISTNETFKDFFVHESPQPSSKYHIYRIHVHKHIWPLKLNKSTSSQTTNLKSCKHFCKQDQKNMMSNHLLD
ncbi:glycosyltransferase family 4 protein, partial [Patescibacteria group bacterium]